MSIEELIPVGHDNAINRAELRYIANTNDRELRASIEDAIKRGTAIINLGDGVGYFRPSLDEKDLLAEYIAKEHKRAMAILVKLMPLKDLLEDMEAGRLDGREFYKDQSKDNGLGMVQGSKD